MHRQRPVIDRDDHVRTLINCEGLYDCKDPERGPLVGYAGTYDDNGTKKRYVGHRYFNVAMAEQWPHVIEFFAFRLLPEILGAMNMQPVTPDVILGAPMGGVVLGQNLARAINCRYVFAEKVFISAGECDQRGKEKLVLGRHDIFEGEKVGICEDIANNFTTTLELMKLVLAAGGIPQFLACAVNRSDKTEYVVGGVGRLPVASLIHQPTPQYRQDDPMVAELVKTGKVIWKPKHHWPKLKAAMEAA